MDLNTEALDGILAKAAGSSVVPGIAATVVTADEVVYQGFAGTLSPDGGERVNERTMFRYASVTKSMATAGVMQLVESGTVELDDPVEKYVPEFGRLQVLDGFEGDEPVLRAPASSVTIRHLLTHTSGLGYFFTNADLARWMVATGAANPIGSTRDALNTPLIADPGTEWNYGIGIDWAGLVLEAVTGQRLGEYLTEHLWGPLGMEDNTFHPTDEQRERMMGVCDRTDRGDLAASPIDLPPVQEVDCGGHGSYGTVEGFGRFLRAMLRGGELDGNRVLQAETVEQMFTDQLPAMGVEFPQLIESQVPELSNDIPSLPIEQGWGLGFHLANQAIPGMRSAGTGDWAGLMNLYYWIDRKAGVAGATMTQVLPFFDPGIVEVLLGVEGTVYAALGAEAPAAA